MRPPARLVPFVLLLAAPTAVSAQLGVGTHLGTTGFGADVAVALSPNVQLRGTAGVMPIEPSWTLADIDVTADVSDSFVMAGIDLFPTRSGFRLGAGVLFKPDDPILTGLLSGPTRVGERTYTPEQVGALIGAVESRESAPYLIVGFGRHASKGIGLFVDLGAAFVGRSRVALESLGGTLSEDPQFQAEVAREEAEWQARIDASEVYPIVNLGLRVGIGN